MKRLVFFFAMLISFVPGTFAGHIIKAPGDVIDIYNCGIRISTNVLDCDTIFVEGGTGNITLQAGIYNASYSYDWDIDGGSLTTHQVTFTYALSGRQVVCSKWIPSSQDQLVYVIYRSSALKPSTPSGATSACIGSSGDYTSTSTNADSYRWTISPGTAGTTSSTTGTANITWSASWTGKATITVEGKKGSAYSPVSDGLEVTVGTAPTKPTISGNELVKVNTFKTYTANGSGTTAWTLTPASGLATKAVSGDDVVLTFGTTSGNLSVTVTRTNSCGTSPSSDAFAIEIVDPSATTALVTQVNNLKVDTAVYRKQVRDSIPITKQLRIDKSSLTGQIATLTTDKSLLTTQVSGLKTDTVLYRKQVRDTIPVTKQLRIDKSTLAGQVTTLNTDKATLTTQLNTANTDKTKALTHVGTLQTDSIATHSALTTANADKTSLQTQVTTLTPYKNDSVPAWKTKYATLNALAIDYANQIQDLDKKIAAQNDTIKYYKQSYSIQDDGSIILSIKTVAGDFSVKVYPNPTWGPATITSSETLQKIEIFDLTGKSVYLNTNPNTKEIEINLSEITSIGGFYVIKTTTAKGYGSVKILRNK